MLKRAKSYTVGMGFPGFVVNTLLYHLAILYLYSPGMFKMRTLKAFGDPKGLSESSKENLAKCNFQCQIYYYYYFLKIGILCWA